MFMSVRVSFCEADGSVDGLAAGVCGLVLFAVWVVGESPPPLPQAVSATARMDKERARDRFVMIFSLS